MTEAIVRKHSLTTRLFHAGLGLSVSIQLLTSLVLEAPEPHHAGNWFFSVHQYAGLAAFGFVAGFWLIIAFRRRKTAWGLLLPWTSPARLSAVWHDIKAHLTALLRFRLPDYDEQSPLASAVHGLGLLLISAMAATGTAYYFINQGDPDAGGLVGVVMFIHTTLANLVWAYLIGHAGLAVLHHLDHSVNLRDMWSFSNSPRKVGQNDPQG